jgi:hypothetical protein
MSHTFFALFPSGEQAQAALDEVRQSPVLRESDVRVHESGIPQEDLSLLETEGREGLHRGAVVGALCGGLTAVLVFARLGQSKGGERVAGAQTTR